MVAQLPGMAFHLDSTSSLHGCMDRRLAVALRKFPGWLVHLPCFTCKNEVQKVYLGIWAIKESLLLIVMTLAFLLPFFRQ
jgi:hypothetical protein